MGQRTDATDFVPSLAHAPDPARVPGHHHQGTEEGEAVEEGEIHTERTRTAVEEATADEAEEGTRTDLCALVLAHVPVRPFDEGTEDHPHEGALQATPEEAMADAEDQGVTLYAQAALAPGLSLAPVPPVHVPVPLVPVPVHAPGHTPPILVTAVAAPEVVAGPSAPVAGVIVVMILGTADPGHPSPKWPVACPFTLKFFLYPEKIMSL